MKEIKKLPESSRELHKLIADGPDQRVSHVNPSTGQRIDAVGSKGMSLEHYQIDCWVGSVFYPAIEVLDSQEVFDCFVDICTGDKVYQYGERYTKN